MAYLGLESCAGGVATAGWAADPPGLCVDRVIEHALVEALAARKPNAVLDFDPDTVEWLKSSILPALSSLLSENAIPLQFSIATIAAGTVFGVQFPDASSTAFGLLALHQVGAAYYT